MSYKDILAPLLSFSADTPVLAAAEAVARDHGAKLTALMVEVKAPPLYTLEGLATELAFDEVVKAEHALFEADMQRLDAAAARSKGLITAGSISAVQAHLARAVAARAHYSDLTVIMRPMTTDREYDRAPLFEGALFESGRPVLLIPPQWTGAAIGRKIVVAWNGQREAARALADAEPFLMKAQSIDIVTVSLKADTPHFDLSSAERAVAHLARRGIDVAKPVALNPVECDEAGALITHARVLDADLIVMGGYGHARMFEKVMGGVTREMIAFSPFPILMSH